MRDFIHKIFGIQNKQIVESGLDLAAPLGEVEFVAFDTELTGLNFKKDSIISIGAVGLRGGRILAGKTFYRLVKPISDLNKKSVVIHEITHEELKEAEDLQTVLPSFIEFIGSNVLMGHFVHIDINFVNKSLGFLSGHKLFNAAVDTSTLHDWLYENDSQFARHHAGMSADSNLFSLAKRYGVPAEKGHNAFYDAYLTAQLFQRFLPFLSDCGIKNLKDLLDVGKP